MAYLDASGNALENVIALVQLAQEAEFDASGAKWNVQDNPLTHEDTLHYLRALRDALEPGGVVLHGF